MELMKKKDLVSARKDLELVACSFEKAAKELYTKENNESGKFSFVHRQLCVAVTKAIQSAASDIVVLENMIKEE